MGVKKFTAHEMRLVVDENDLLKKENLRLRREVSALQKRVTSLLLQIGDRAHKVVPRVRLVDGDGKELYRGYYFAYPEYQGYPIIANGENQKEIPLVEGIVTYDPGDWGLSNTPRVLKVTPPHRLELIPEGEL